MLELKIKCTRFESIYNCSTHSNNNNWIKAITTRKTRRNTDLIKFGANLSFNPL